MKKSGWDCMRHYEILANGCVPVFLDINNCPELTMTSLPKDKLLEVLTISKKENGIKELIDSGRYNEYNEFFVNHLRNFCTTKNMANYILEIGHKYNK